jgi:hypothetical protein
MQVPVPVLVLAVGVVVAAGAGVVGVVQDAPGEEGCPVAAQVTTPLVHDCPELRVIVAQALLAVLT